jgi:hypothetical protein
MLFFILKSNYCASYRPLVHCVESGHFYCFCETVIFFGALVQQPYRIDGLQPATVSVLLVQATNKV